MPPKTHHQSPAGKAFSSTIQSLRNNSALFIPFIIFFLFESLALTFAYLIPRQPLVAIFGPIIKTFWGERYLHYPLNFLLLPKLDSLSRMCLSVIIGSLLSGMAIAILIDIVHYKRQPRIATSLKHAAKKYIFLFAIVLFTTVSFYALVKLSIIILAKYFIAGHQKLLFLGIQFWMGKFILGWNFLLGIFIQAAFIYTIPAIIIDNDKLIKAAGKSLLLFKRCFIPTLILVGGPMLMYVPLIVLGYNIPFLITRFFPESVLFLSYIDILLTSLIIDPVITIATAFFYLANKETIS